MNQRRWWIGIAAGGFLCAAGLGAVIWYQHKSIDETKGEIATLRGNIDSSRKLIEGTSALEREVIVLRELTEVMKGVLPDNNDVNNLVRTLQTFCDDSGLRTTNLKKKSENSREKSDFERVAYTLQFEGDTFQFLKFLDRVESHTRFIRVPNFHVSTQQRNTSGDKNAAPTHKIQIDVETFVYEPKKDEKTAKIDGYDRKRDLLLGEINRRKQALTVSSYTYRGPRGRRDPFIDPRVPVNGEGESALSVQEQMDIVQGLFDRTQAVLAKWGSVKSAENVIVEMMTRAELENDLAKLEEDIRRIEAEKSIRYVPSERRFHSEIVDPITALRGELSASAVTRGPSEAQLKQIEETMLSHQDRAEYKLMLEAYGVVEKELAIAKADPLRKPLVERLEELAHEANTVIEFQKIDMKITGVLIQGAQACALINGKTLFVGDMLDNRILVRAIKPDEVEFVFRGVIFARQF
ncbi:MAG: type 4a pilus biogenesis protein PilO [Planctomycetota bacterium]